MNMAKLIEDRTGWRENQIKFNKEKSENNLKHEDSAMGGGSTGKQNLVTKMAPVLLWSKIVPEVNFQY